jgi:hypothetical protein
VTGGTVLRYHKGCQVRSSDDYEGDIRCIGHMSAIAPRKSSDNPVEIEPVHPIP